MEDRLINDINSELERLKNSEITNIRSQLNQLKYSEIESSSNLIDLKVIQKSKKPNIIYPKDGYKVTVHYKGMLRNGKIFDNSWEKGKPITFTVGKGSVIKGWDIIIKKIKLGEKVRVVIPSNLAYGAKGIGNIIKPFSDLIFIIKLLKINNIS